MKHGIFVPFQSAKPKVYSPIPCFFSFYVPSHMHLQTWCASSNDFSVLIVLMQFVYFDLSLLVSSLPFLQSLLA